MTEKRKVTKATHAPSQDLKADLHQAIRQLLLAARTQVA